MGTGKNTAQIPFFDFRKDPRALEQGSEEWDLLCKEVRAAAERYGCFEVGYDGVPVQLREDMFEAMKSLFELPVETKKKNYSPRPYHGYIGESDVVPLYESLGVEDAPTLDAARAFTDLMWPDGNPWFCETLNSMSKKMWELVNIVQKMIFDSYGVGKYYKWHVENSGGILRVMKYKVPDHEQSAGEEESAVTGLVAHTDKGILTALCQSEVQGLQVLSKEDGQWIHLPPRPSSFVIIVGDSFKAWSNGRLHPATHRVMMRGDKDRYSFALFAIPKEKMTIEAPQELVDKDHPLIFRPFNYSDYMSFTFSNEKNVNRENSLEVFAGV